MHFQLRTGLIAATTIAATGLTIDMGLATTCCSSGGELPEHVVNHLRRSQVSINTPGGWRGKALAAKQVRSGLRSGPRGVTGVLDVPVLCFGFNNVNIPANTVANLQTELFDGPWATGTMSDYWLEVSYGAFTFDGTVFNAGNLAQNDTVYEAADNGMTAANITAYVSGAVQGADATVNFAQYDNDGPDGVPNSGDDDGVVDLLALVHPEFGGENTNIAGNNNIWSHRWTYASASGAMLNTADDAAGGGKIQINNYTIMPALNNASNLIEMGVFAHEFGHALGLPDLYDRDNSGGEGVGWHCLMGAGNWNQPASPAHLSVWCRAELGWVEPQLMIGNYDDFNLRAIASEAAAMKIVHDPAGVEYFLVENRQPIGFDQNLVDCGIVIWHVDPSVGTAWNDNEWCTGGATHSYLAPEQADGRCDLEFGINRGDNGDFWDGDPTIGDFDPNSVPNSRPYSGTDTGMKLTDFSDCTATMSFDAHVESLPITEARPLDVLFIFDASGSYDDDLPNMLAQMPSVIDDIQDKFPDPRFGVGSFRDFPVAPNGNSGDWVWRLDLDLTDDEPELLTKLGAIVADGGGDIPESQYEAVYQAMVGNGIDLDGDNNPGNSDGEVPSQPVSWDTNRAPIIFVMTDAQFHDADTEDYPNGMGEGVGRFGVLAEIQNPTVLHETPRIFTLNAAWDGPTFSQGSQGGSPWDPGILYEQASELGVYSGGSIIAAGTDSVDFRVAVQEALNLLAMQMPSIGTCCWETGDCLSGVTMLDCTESLGGNFAPGEHVCETDCNDNGKPDGCEIAFGWASDVNDNNVPDECECIGDVNYDGSVDIDDLLLLLSYWGPCSNCTDVDLDGNGHVDIDDLLIALGNWGDCPSTSECASTEIEDCFGNCVPRTWRGDGTCDDGSYYYNGHPIFLNCEEHGWDGGDCPSCASGEIADCNGNCCPADWVGDGYCDDGTYIWNGVPIFLNCDQYNNDGGDCP